MATNETGGVNRRGRYPDGRKRRWTRAQKSAVKRARAKELLSIARSWRSELQAGEVESTTPTYGRVGKWVEELPWELWELIFENLNAVDCLRYGTTSKMMIGRYEVTENLVELRREAREVLQEAREEIYAQHVEAAVDYYITNNIQLRQPGIGYRYVAR